MALGDADRRRAVRAGGEGQEEAGRLGWPGPGRAHTHAAGPRPTPAHGAGLPPTVWIALEHGARDGLGLSISPLTPRPLSLLTGL